MNYLPAGWRRATLAEIGVDAQPGFASGKHNNDGQGIAHLRPMNITRDGRIDLSDVRYVEDEVGRRVDAGDVLFNNTNSPALVGKTALVTSDKPLAYSNHMTRLRTPDALRADFLAHQLHWLWMSGYFKTVLNNHVNQASVDRRRLLATSIVMPPTLAEQERIVLRIEDSLGRLRRSCDSLGRAAIQCAAYKRTVEDLAVLGRLIPPEVGWLTAVQADLGEIAANRSLQASKRNSPPKEPSELAFQIPDHWRVVSVDQLCKKIQYGTSVRTVEASGPGNIPVLRMGNIQSADISMDKLKYLPEGTPGISELMLEDGDLLFNRTNSAELVGKSAVYRKHLGPATFASYLIRCQFADGVIPEWVNLVINSSIGRAYVASAASQQVGQANVNGTKLAKMPIPFPPLREQERVLAAVGGYSELAKQFSQTIQFCLNGADSLRDSILTAAFAGRLVPRNAEGAALNEDNHE